MSRAPLSRLLGVHRIAAVPLALSVAGVLVLVGARFRLTFLAASWVDGPLRSGDPSRLPPLLATAAFATLVAAGGLLVSRLALSVAVQRVEDSLRRRASESLIGAPLGSVGARGGTGAGLSVVVHDTAAAAAFTPALVKRLGGDGAVAAAGVVSMLVLDPALTLAALSAVPLGALVLSLSARRLRLLGARQQEAAAALSAFLAERVHALASIKGLGTAASEAAAFRAANREYRRALVRSELLSGALLSAVWLATGAGIVAVVALGALRVATGALTPGMLLAFGLAAGQAIEPLRRLGEAMASVQAALAAAARVFAVTDLPAEDLGEPGGPHATPGVAVVLEDVRFGYRGGEDVLRGVSLAIEPGEAVGIVAASGGGKSTLASILGGLLSPCAGRLSLGGADSRSLGLARRRTLASLAPQEPFVFAGTLAENVRYGAPGATEGEVAAAAAAAGLARAEGAAAVLAEAGRDLSGGEKQRVCLARAVLARAPLVILDEATSALDPEAEEALLSRLRPALAGRTLVVFSHRLVTVARLPRVVVLERGRVVADGPPERLAEGSEAFRRLFAPQLGAAWARPARAQQG